MIAEVTSPECYSESLAMKARSQPIERQSADDSATKIVAEEPGVELASEHRLLSLAYRKFEALLPDIETLSADVE